MLLSRARTTEQRHPQPITSASGIYLSVEIFSDMECGMNLKVQGMFVNWGIKVGEFFKKK